MRNFLIVTAALLVAGPAHAQARWHVAVEAGDLRFSGTSADTSSDRSGTFRPYRPTAAALRLERGGDGLRVGLGLVYASGPVALIGPDVTVSVEGSPLTMLEIAPVVSARLLRLGSGALHLSAGPVIDRWSWSVAPARWRVGGEVAARIEAPLGGSTALLVRGALSRSGSMLDDGDLPPAFERRPAWRRALAVGFALRR